MFCSLAPRPRTSAHVTGDKACAGYFSWLSCWNSHFSGKKAMYFRVLNSLTDFHFIFVLVRFTICRLGSVSRASRDEDYLFYAFWIPSLFTNPGPSYWKDRVKDQTCIRLARPTTSERACKQRKSQRHRVGRGSRGAAVQPLPWFVRHCSPCLELA